jgi:hypothetical protein
MRIYDEIFILGIFIGIVFLAILVVLAILINDSFKPQPTKKQSKEKADGDFNPLSWAITFFTMWYTLLTIHSNPGFGRICFVISCILLISVYVQPIKTILASSEFINLILPVIFILSVFTLIFGVILALNDLSVREQATAMVFTLVIMGTYLAVEISQVKVAAVRMIGCILTVIVFTFYLIARFQNFGFVGNWPIILFILQCFWATFDPERFRGIPLV